MHAAVETTVFPVVAQVIADTTDRCKLLLLESDLHALGAEPADTGAAFLDEAYEDSVPFNLGMAYVIEGSSLGGRFLLKNVRKTLGDTVPAAYFDAYGERTGSLWKGFLQQLAAWSDRASAGEHEAVLRGAVYGFDRTAVLFARFSEAVVQDR
jgi:heme oxygenase